MKGIYYKIRRGNRYFAATWTTGGKKKKTKKKNKKKPSQTHEKQPISGSSKKLRGHFQWRHLGSCNLVQQFHMLPLDMLYSKH